MARCLAGLSPALRAPRPGLLWRPAAPAARLPAPAVKASRLRRQTPGPVQGPAPRPQLAACAGGPSSGAASGGGGGPEEARQGQQGHPEPEMSEEEVLAELERLLKEAMEEGPAMTEAQAKFVRRLQQAMEQFPDAGPGAPGEGEGAQGPWGPGQPDPNMTEAELQAEWERRVQQAVGDLQGMGLYAPAEGDAAGAAVDEALQLQLAMGTWRLRNLVCKQIQVLVAQIEDAWRSILGDLQLYPLPKEFKYMDSLDPEGKTPFSYIQLKSPERGAEGWPRLQVENRCYQSRVFRKLHLEVAARQDGLQVLHCVMYPRQEFDLPILSLDLVANSGRVSLAIIDPCPVNSMLRLPPLYQQAVRDFQADFEMESNRGVPDWGRAIFSQECVILRPTDEAQVDNFLKYASSLSEFHVQLGRLANAVPASQRQRRQELTAAHQRYCDKQLENDKTRQVLAKAFGAEKAETYMRKVMFDCEPAAAESSSSN